MTLAACSSPNTIKKTRKLRGIAPYAPDDSGYKWDSPDRWSARRIHFHVIKHLGQDVVFPRGYEVLVKLWEPPEQTAAGIYTSETGNRELSYRGRCGLVLRMGAECCIKSSRFPIGSRFTYGEWVLFSMHHKEHIFINGHTLTNIRDDQIQAVTRNPELVITTVNMFDELGAH